MAAERSSRTGRRRRPRSSPGGDSAASRGAPQGIAPPTPSAVGDAYDSMEQSEQAGIQDRTDTREPDSRLSWEVGFWAAVATVAGALIGGAIGWLIAQAADIDTLGTVLGAGLGGATAMGLIAGRLALKPVHKYSLPEDERDHMTGA